MTKKKIRIGLHNVQSGIGTVKGYWQYFFHLPKYFWPHHSGNIKKIGQLIKKEQVDIFAAVEVDQGSFRTKKIDQVRLLQTSSRLRHSIFFPSFQRLGIAHQGNTIHSRFPILESKNHRLPGTGEPRYAGEAKIKVGQKNITVFVTHLSLDSLHRKSQIQRLAKHINAVQGPIILAGDFNIRHEGELELLEKSRLQKVYTAKTFPVWKPTKRLDYIFASREIHIDEGRVIDTPLADHCLLLVDVEV